MSYDPNAYGGYPPPAPPPKKKRKIWPWIVGAVLLLLFLGMCSVSAQNTAQQTPGVTSSASATASAIPSPTPSSTPPPAAAAPAGPKTEFGDGTWEIGVDIVPGKYKSTGPSRQGLPCFAQTTKEGDDSLGDIVKQEVTEGPSTFIIPAKGVKFFESSGCGTWKKAG